MNFSRQHFERVAEFLPQLPWGLNVKDASPVSSPPQPVLCRARGGDDRSGHLFPVSRVR
jgi:hypothetical protein